MHAAPVWVGGYTCAGQAGQRPTRTQSTEVQEEVERAERHVISTVLGKELQGWHLDKIKRDEKERYEGLYECMHACMRACLHTFSSAR